MAQIEQESDVAAAAFESGITAGMEEISPMPAQMAEAVGTAALAILEDDEGTVALPDHEGDCHF